MNRNKILVILAVGLLATWVMTTEVSAQCNPCQPTCCPPQTYTAYQPVVAAAPAVRPGWYPGKLFDTWRLRRQARRASLVSSGTTCYRPVTRAVPVTTYRAVTGCDPCTGCPTTTYRPVTVMGCQTCYVPQTANRQVLYRPLARGAWWRPGCCGNTVAAPTCGSDPCGGCSTGVTTASTYATTTDSGCCSASPSMPSYSSPSTPTYPGGETTPQPTLDSNNPTPTFQQRPVGEPAQPEPEAETNATGFEPPKLVDPHERTADWGSAKVRAAVYSQPVKPQLIVHPKPVKHPNPAKRSQVQTDADGWHSVPRDR